MEMVLVVYGYLGNLEWLSNYLVVWNILSSWGFFVMQLFFDKYINYKPLPVLYLVGDRPNYFGSVY